MAVSPLVARQAPPQTSRVPQTPLASAITVAEAEMKTPMARPPLPSTGAENIGEDVSSPAAAKARTTLVNSSFIADIKTPASIFRKTPQISLQKAVLLSTGVCVCVCVCMYGVAHRRERFSIYCTCAYTLT